MQRSRMLFGIFSTKDRRSKYICAERLYNLYSCLQHPPLPASIPPPLNTAKRSLNIIWGVWVATQTALLFYTEFVQTNWALKFFVGFVLSLVRQYVIFFVATKGRFAQRIFTMLTYSIFFCIVMSLFAVISVTFSELHWALISLVQAVLLLGIVTYFLRYMCPLCRTASKNITTGWASLIFVNVVFIITIILSSVFPVRPTSFREPAFITFVFLSISIMAVYGKTSRGLRENLQ